MSKPFMGTWHVFGQRKDVSFDELSDVGRVMIGGCPVKHEWAMIAKDRSAYCLGPRVARLSPKNDHLKRPTA